MPKGSLGSDKFGVKRDVWIKHFMDEEGITDQNNFDYSCFYLETAVILGVCLQVLNGKIAFLCCSVMFNTLYIVGI